MNDKLLSQEIKYNYTIPETVESRDSVFTRSSENGYEISVIRRNSAGNLMQSLRIDKRFTVSSKRKYIIINYYDEGEGQWFLEYQSYMRPNHHLYNICATPVVKLHDTQQWRKISFEISDGVWEEQFGNADLRITIVDDTLDRFLISGIIIQDAPLESVMIINEHLAGKSNSSNISSAYKYLTQANNEFQGSFPKVEKPVVTIIIPVFNRLGYTLDCLSAVKCYTEESYEIIVVDNASSDDSSEHLSVIQNLIYIRLNKNYGFAHACNQGVEKATAQNILFLNNDTIVRPGWLQPMLDLITRQPNTGIVGSKLIYPQTGLVQHAGVEKGPDSLPRHRYHMLPASDHRVNETLKLVAVTGACLLTTKKIYAAVGGFDEAYLNGYEDVDYCYKVSKSGMDIFYCHKSCVYHYESITEGRLDQEVDRKNLVLFGQRWLENFCFSNYENTMLDEKILPVDLVVTDPLLGHLTGRIDGWDIVCDPGVDKSGHCLYGHIYEFNDTLEIVVVFNFSITNPLDDETPLVSLDVYDRVTDEILMHESLHLGMTGEGETSYALDIQVDEGQQLEYRVYWHGNCHLSLHKLSLHAANEYGKSNE